MPFSFNFTVESSCEATSSETETETELNKDDKPPVAWKACREHLIEDSHLEKITQIDQILTFPVGQQQQGEEEKEEESLNIVDSEAVSRLLAQEGYQGDLSPALAGQDCGSDLLPGQYEGGLKIWECSEDLVNFLSQTRARTLQGKKVLELGCGAGLPGLLAFKHRAVVWFNDYNADVLKQITIPNVLLNVPSTEETETRFFSGDWQSLEENFLRKEITEESCKFDLILTSETIYNQENQSKLVSIFKHFLKKDGEVLVAAKTFYFGVGGGLRQFEKLVKRENLKSEIVKTFDNGGVKREIIRINL